MDAKVRRAEKRLPCAKYNRDQDGDNPRCSDPDLYCKHRTSCLIHFMEKSRRRETEQ